jgi:chromosome segregation ATPase
MIGVMENKKLSYEEAQNGLKKRDPYSGVILETLKDKMDLLLEGHETAQKRIDRLDGRMGRVEAKLDKVEIKVDILQEKVDGMDAKLDNLAKDIGKKVGKSEDLALGNRVTKLEAI